MPAREHTIAINVVCPDAWFGSPVSPWAVDGLVVMLSDMVCNVMLLLY